MTEPGLKEVEKIINDQFVPLEDGGWRSYTSPKGIAQALSQAGLLRQEVDESLLKMLKEMIDFCNFCGNFANGVEYNGIDEGIYKSSEIIDRAKKLVDSIDSGEVFKK